MLFTKKFIRSNYMKKVITLAIAVLVLLGATGCTKKDDTITGDTGYKIGMASYTTTDKSSPSTSVGNGKGSVSTTCISAIFDNDNIIKKVYIDEVEADVYFDAMGQLVPDSAGEVKSKRELGDAYNMKPASPIGKEWYEQIDYLEKYLEGKKVTDIISGIGDISTRQGTYQRNTDFNAISDSMDGTGGTTDGSMTQSGMTDTTSIMGDGTMTDSTMIDGSSMMNDTDGSSMMDDTSGTGDTMWQEDLKSSVTIDLTNIQMALKKAYENAR